MSHPRALSSEIVAAIVEERLTHKRCAEVIHATLAKRGMAVSLSSVKRTLKRHELVPSRKWKRYRPPVARPPVDSPGSLVQTDTIHFLDWKTKKKFYLYTVIDLYTRMAYAAVHDRISQRWSYQTLLEAQSLFGFDFQTVQADNGPEFATWLKDMLKSKNIILRHSRVRQSNDNATSNVSTVPYNKNCSGLGRYAAKSPSSVWMNGFITITMTDSILALSYKHQLK